MTAARAPDVAQYVAPGVVLLGPLGVRLVRRAVEVTADLMQRRDGIGPPPQLRELAEVLGAASAALGTGPRAAGGTAEPPGRRDRAASGVQDDPVDVVEVAQVLECSPGYVRRLCRTGQLESARLVRGRWLVTAVEVEALRAARTQGRGTAP